MADNVSLSPDNSSSNFQAQQPKQKFPYSIEDKKRLDNYNYFEKLFYGDHYDAFRIRIQSNEFNVAYSKLRYVMINFSGLISKIVADMLFSEPITIRVPDGDQEFLEGLIRENNFGQQLYESALQNSYFGDALLKSRYGKRHKNNEDMTVIIEDTTPRIYFPKIDPFNARAYPEKQELAWIFRKGDKQYLRKEIHEPGKIFNQVFLMNGDEVVAPDSLSLVGLDDADTEQDTGIDRSLVQHIPNWKVGTRWNGISDYFDLDSLFFAINNRMSKNDNVLDKHTDPILMVPPGVLDENGKPKKRDGRVIEIGNSDEGKPEYIVWDASLENAFKQIEKLIEFIYLIAEISPDVLGLGQGVSDSGRALKFKLMRTIAKVSRKKLYYDAQIKECLYVAQMLAKVNGVTINGKTMKGEPVVPEIIWQDGLPIDDSELIDTETKALDAQITTRIESIMRVYKVDKKTAEKIAKDAKDENAVPLPDMGFKGKPPTLPNPQK